LGEETQKIIESSKSAKKGEVVTIKDLKALTEPKVPQLNFNSPEASYGPRK
jgi:hypothetical protein